MPANNLLIPYKGFSGEEITIRSIYKEDGELLISLEDIVNVLAIENKKLSSTQGRSGLGGLIKAAIDVLDEDEKRFIPLDNENRKEIFVTQPGMYRIVSRDSSPACKKFQRWLFHDVLPSIQKYGTYPPPIINEGSDIKSLAEGLVRNSQIILREIEEREKLQAIVIDKFEMTEEEINSINQRIDNLSRAQPNNLHSLNTFCIEKEIAPDTQSLISAWCNKICLEKNLEMNQEEQRYPIYVIEEAAKITLEKIR